MSQQHTRIAIIGGGLSGLYTAYRLDRAGVHDWAIFESRASLGGRILSISVGDAGRATSGVSEHLNRFDLGPTWFWPEIQPALDDLIAELGLARFPQFDAGDMMVERSAREEPLRARGYASAPSSMRLAGGMGALIDALTERLDPARVLTDHALREIRIVDTNVLLCCQHAGRDSIEWLADHVLLALPPRLVSQSIRFTPALPAALLQRWQATPTWMAPHAKYVAVYERPFWRDSGLSGHARSARGPMVEIHDASMPAGDAALFGFVGVPARMRQRLPEGALRTHCRDQLVRLFGREASAPIQEFIKDWACDPNTATQDDLEGDGQHPNAPIASTNQGPWQGRITGVGSEWSPQFSGYLAGCIEAADRGIEPLLEKVRCA